jgi:hypothetical protein
MVVALLQMSAAAAQGLILGLTMCRPSAAAWAEDVLQHLLLILEKPARLADGMYPYLISILCICVAGHLTQTELVQASLCRMGEFVRQTALQHATGSSPASLAHKVALDSITTVTSEVLVAVPAATTVAQFYSLAASLLKAASVPGLAEGIGIVAQVSGCLVAVLGSSPAPQPYSGSCLMLLGRCLLQLSGTDAEQLAARIQGAWRSAEAAT